MKTPMLATRMLAALPLAMLIAWAQPSLAPPQALAPPQIGFVQDQLGSFRRIYGLAGNFILGGPTLAGVISATFSGSSGLLKTGSAILLTDAQGYTVATTNAPGGPALLAFSGNGRSALAYVIDSNRLFQWNDAGFVALPLDPGAIAARTIWSVAQPDPGHAAFIVERTDGLWDVRLRLSTGQVDAQTSLAGIKPPAFMLATGDVLSRDAAGLVLRRPDGSQVHIAAQLPETYAVQQIGDGWLSLRDTSNGREFAVRVIQNHEAVYALPEVSQ